MSSFWGALPPEIVYVPCAPVEPGAAEVQVMLRTLAGADGSTTLVLPAYSSVDELVQACGDAQRPGRATAPSRSAQEMPGGGLIISTESEHRCRRARAQG